MHLNKRIFVALLFSFIPILVSSFAHSQQLNLTITIPALDVSPYHRPYVAVWLETPKRQSIKTIAIWYEQDDWLKDLRQWWRKAGRNNRAQYDAATGATRKPGQYTLQWDGNDASGKPLPAGDYVLLIEAAREAGGRDFLRQVIQWGGEPQHYQLEGQLELGTIAIDIQ